ncbi:MAG: glycosyltransferase family 2 protein [Planctomycetes bacterium]|nr:glycosyltransferase family 2 protein [Planctomycetota bacterium]MCB9869897.1 glycosyltransferase family 2 protein [Planctomycetota bacterium]MCB9889127.1 glycosyltransferase family 2 protein [Planctomycetota bacterium]
MRADVPDVADGGWQVPAAELRQLGARRNRYCIAVFVLNEGERLHRQLAKMVPYTEAVDVVVADGGSSDGAIEDERLRGHGVTAVLVKQGPGRLGAQMRMAFAYALRSGYQGVLTIDGNDKDDPAAIPSFVDALDRGVDHVQGSRFVPGGRAVRTPWSRWLGIRWIHAPRLSRAAGFRYTDTTNGFRAYSRRFLLDPRVAPFRDVFSSYALHYYLAVRAGELGYRIAELPVTRSYPAKGPTPTKITPLRGNLEVLRTLAAVCRHEFDPPDDGGSTVGASGVRAGS